MAIERIVESENDYQIRMSRMLNAGCQGQSAGGNFLTQAAPPTGTHLPTNPEARKKIPLYSGLVKYFPDALVAVAQLSQRGNDQHNPGEPLHWAREKSTDQEDTLLRHLFEAGTFDTDGCRHSAKVAWRALAMLQLEIERDLPKKAGVQYNALAPKDAEPFAGFVRK